MGRPGRGASEVEKSPRLNWGTQFLTVAYAGARSPNVSVKGMNFLRRLTLQEKNLLTARVSMLLKSCASPDMLPFSLRNKKRLAIRHMNRPLLPTTLSILSYDIGKEVGLKTYQHPHISSPDGNLIFISYRQYNLKEWVVKDQDDEGSVKEGLMDWRLKASSLV